MRSFAAYETKVYTDTDRMRQVRRCLFKANSYREFQNYVLSCTPKLLLHHGSGRDLTVQEISRLAKVNLQNKVEVGKVFAQYFKCGAADYAGKQNMVLSLKSMAEMDMRTIEMLSRNSVNDLEAWFYDQKFGTPAKRKTEKVQLSLFE